MLKEEIFLDENSNRVSISINIDDKEVYDILSDKSSEEKIDIIKRSVKIGIMALKNAVVTVDVNYVKNELEVLTSNIDMILKENLGGEGMKGSLDSIFGKNGSLELQLKNIFKSHEIIINDILSENNINSPLYKIRKFIEENSMQIDRKIYAMLDPGSRDSLLSRLRDDIVRKIDDIKKSGDIDTINKLVENIKISNRGENDALKKDIQSFRDDYNNRFIDIKKSFHEEIGGVKTVITGVNLELSKLVKEKEVVDKTTLKGMKFEDVIYEFLSTKALTKYGDTINVVNLSGGDKAGDIIINIKDSKEKIVVKAESTSKENVQTIGTILKHLNNTMQERNVEYGIKVYENELPFNIGPVLIGDKKIICSYLRGHTFEGYPLEVAYETLRSEILRKAIGIDDKDVKIHVDNIVRSLSSVHNISGNLTKMENICVNTRSQIVDLRINIANELDQMLEKSVGKHGNIEEKEECSDEESKKRLGRKSRKNMT